MPQATYSFPWIAQAVANLMRTLGIRNRRHLAEVLGMSASSINYSFDENWQGEATLQVLAQMCGVLGVPMGQLVVEPMLANSRIAAAQRGSLRPSAADTARLPALGDRKTGHVSSDRLTGHSQTTRGGNATNG